MFPNLSITSFTLQNSKEEKIKMMKQLHTNVEAEVNTLILRDANKESY